MIDVIYVPHSILNVEQVPYMLPYFILIFILPCSLLKVTEQCRSCGPSVTSAFPMMFSWMCNLVTFGRQFHTFRGSSCETAMRRFRSGFHISCTLFVLFSSGHYEIAATTSSHVQPSHSLPLDSKQLVSELTFMEVMTGNVIHPIKFRP